MDREEIRKGLQAIFEIVTEANGEQKPVDETVLLRDELGLDSLQVVEMLFEIEERFGARIEDEEAISLVTAADVINTIQSKLAAMDSQS